ncbi:hypothetical protein OEZ86_005655 [Tetradesmus obliquus]|nr:hypothetical protein OEZ86_005655 [Tetradesmus obliquus]
MDVDEAPTHELACPRPSLRCLVPASPSEQAELSARVHSTAAYNHAAARFAQPHKPQPSTDSRNLQNLGLPHPWAAAQGQAPARSAALPAYAAAAPTSSPAAASAGGSMYVPAGSCSSPSSSELSRHQALLELVHILQRLRASSVCTEDAALPTLLSASQCAIQCVNSSMHVAAAPGVFQTDDDSARRHVKVVKGRNVLEARAHCHKNRWSNGAEHSGS